MPQGGNDPWRIVEQKKKELRERRVRRAFKYVCLQFINRAGLLQAFLLLIVLLYVGVTSFVILFFERPHEQRLYNRTLERLAAKHAEQLENILGRMENGTLVYRGQENSTENYTKDDLIELLAQELKNYSTNMNMDCVNEVRVKEKQKKPLWNLKNANYYTMTLYTTIGYGDIVCSTTEGKFLSMLFSVAGIPLMLLLISSVSRLFIIWFGYLYNCIYNRRFGCCEEHSADLSPTFCLLITLGFLILSGFGLYIRNSKRLDWSLFDTFYCWFISLTTIGLGDFVIHDGGIFHVLMTVSGLTLVSLFFTVTYTSLEQKYQALLTTDDSGTQTAHPKRGGDSGAMGVVMGMTSTPVSVRKKMKSCDVQTTTGGGLCRSQSAEQLHFLWRT